MGTGPNGGRLGAQPSRKILVTTPSRLPENEEIAPFKTDYLKKMLCQGYTKNVFLNQGHRRLRSRQSIWELTSQKAKRIEYER